MLFLYKKKIYVSKYFAASVFVFWIVKITEKVRFFRHSSQKKVCGISENICKKYIADNEIATFFF